MDNKLLQVILFNLFHSIIAFTKPVLFWYVTGLPLMVVGLWSFLTYYLQPPSVSAIPYSMDYNNYYEKDGQDRSSRWNGSVVDNVDPVSNAGLELFETENEDGSEISIPENNTTVSDSCPFMVDTTAHVHSEWAYNFPVLLILACNMLFLIYIMTVRK